MKPTKKVLSYENAYRLLKRKQRVLNGFENKIFPIEKQTQGKGNKILTPKQMLQRFPKLKASNISKNLLNEIHQIMYSLYQASKITKKVYNNIVNSIQLWYKIDTIFMNSEKSKTPDPDKLLFNLTNKINLKRSDKEKKKWYFALSNLRIYYTWKNIKKSYKGNKF